MVKRHTLHIIWTNSSRSLIRTAKLSSLSLLRNAAVFQFLDYRQDKGVEEVAAEFRRRTQPNMVKLYYITPFF